MPRKYNVAETHQFARHMRMWPTGTEAKLYRELSQAIENTTARAHVQYVIGPYIADICIPYAQLIIEADGASHAGRKEYDDRRDAYMRRNGYRTLRFKNIEIWQDCAAVVKQIIDACGELKPFKSGEVKITYCPPRYAAGHKDRQRLW